MVKEKEYVDQKNYNRLTDFLNKKYPGLKLTKDVYGKLGENPITIEEMRVIDASGNATTLSPHDDDGQWVFHSKDTVTGEVLHIHMEKLMRRLNDEYGGGFIEEFIER